MLSVLVNLVGSQKELHLAYLTGGLMLNHNTCYRKQQRKAGNSFIQLTRSQDHTRHESGACN